MANQGPPAAVRGLVVMCVAGFAAAVVCEYVGPTRGWLGRLTGQPPPTAQPAAPQASASPAQPSTPSSSTQTAPVATPSPVSSNSGNVADTSVQSPGETRTPEPARRRQPEAAPAGEENDEPVKTEREIEYERLVAGYLKKLPAPNLGKKYKILLRNRQAVEGKLIDISPGKITLQMRYGELTYALHQVHPKSTTKLFPERAAHFMAMRALKKKREAEAEAARKREQAAQAALVRPARPDPAGGTEIATAPTPPRPQRLLPARTGAPTYNTTAAKTPEHLLETVRAFGTWLKFQHQRVGGRIADKIHAKQQGGSVVLYLNANALFLQQDYGTRFQLTEGLYKFWAFRCDAHRVIRELSDAHVVLVGPNGKIIGGSAPRNSADIWVEKDRK
ncbi:MAG: hypothetical protein HN742_40560 [Lentisphaerae bacterium]|jgi:hypothetical protein|nr:hypothetical protein [Lentisphaerota bacterium]MBT4816214.1 hypothetical protein [Lentisphaerota bacterium]MBT5610309.1 hypothetical protein [Lentisphaerota bacterium]MBT7056400.1 hypothetical protein [Lentisphaerota bacterium]MBT7848228.1 hypothetical protein [Lentisphaerota bacterium]